jgi:ABC-type polysaccharide/polyol phosphate export permease
MNDINPRMSPRDCSTGPNGTVVRKEWRAHYMRDLITELIKRDFEVRYRRSVLGNGWSSLKPMSQLVIAPC